mmetsp:Transcript_6888/g.26034  ORF Transcript_6888/g.26034 Transcript_6888/m.26034 type:complete len:334 (+) Transcript_6888:1126-2127(+)
MYSTRFKGEGWMYPVRLVRVSEKRECVKYEIRGTDRSGIPRDDPSQPNPDRPTPYCGRIFPFAARIFFRGPKGTPIECKSASVNSRSASASISSFANEETYFPNPRFRRKSPTRPAASFPFPFSKARVLFASPYLVLVLVLRSPVLLVPLVPLVPLVVLVFPNLPPGDPKPALKSFDRASWPKPNPLPPDGDRTALTTRTTRAPPCRVTVGPSCSRERKSFFLPGPPGGPPARRTPATAVLAFPFDTPPVIRDNTDLTCTLFLFFPPPDDALPTAGVPLGNRPPPTQPCVPLLLPWPTFALNFAIAETRDTAEVAMACAKPGFKNTRLRKIEA